MQVRTNEAGFNRTITLPTFALPAGSCDCHMHIVGPFDRFPLRVTDVLNPPAATADDYAWLQSRTGLQRMVVVQPSFYGADNACTLDAVDRAAGRARGVVVVRPDVSDAELDAMHRRGARGVRLHAVTPGGTSFDALESMAARIRPFGWHIQLFVDDADIEQLAPRLGRLDVPVVFDHMAHLRRESGLGGAGYAALRRMLGRGTAWVKLSNAFFAASGERAVDLFGANPERVVWGTDWPHVGFAEAVPDDGQLLNDLARWLPDAADRERVLVNNPDRLYFAS